MSSKKSKHVFIGIVLYLGGWITVAHADIYRCTQQSGEVRIQQEPCNKSATQRQIAEGEAQPPGNTVVGAMKNEEYAAVWIMLQFKYQCDLSVPGFKEKAALILEKWRSRHFTEIRKIEVDPNFRASMAEAASKIQEPSAKSGLQTYCNENLIDGITQQMQSYDPRYASPQKTWNYLIKSLNAADRDAAISCFAGYTRTKYREALISLPDSALKEMSDSFVTFTPSTSFGSFHEFFVKRKNGQVGIVTFVNSQNAWLIDSM